MNIPRLTTTLALGTALTMLSACGPKEQPVTPTTPAGQARPVTPAQAPEAMPTPAAQSVPSAVTVPASDHAQSLIERIKGLIADKKYPEAMTSLRELSALDLTPDQLARSADLKAQIEKGMLTQGSAEATKSIGGMLGK